MNAMMQTSGAMRGRKVWGGTELCRHDRKASLMSEKFSAYFSRAGAAVVLSQ